ncbi:peptidoglycan-binding protein [Fusobacterium sp.]|jgi:hypothetical protein|uniref:peptidoglycan-binding protein n=1 Tax=Fusobacterium sp. TaxID=68766 RepID=UPI0020473063|nr:peptidoglycan-binding protein [Fusobacterium sp.]DAS42724.1 MAG TPA: tail assembly protein [Caudoviricetes sp.]
MRPTFILVKDSTNTPFFFVVPPLDLRIESEQDLQIIRIIDLGEKTLIGNRKAEKISFSTFFPSMKSPFFSYILSTTPTNCMETLTKLKNNKDKLTLIIPEFNIFFKCYIQTLYFSVTERTGDIDVEITLVEIEKNKTLTDVARGLLER